MDLSTPSRAPCRRSRAHRLALPEGTREEGEAGAQGTARARLRSGSRTFGYRTIPELDPSGRKDHYGDPALLGKRIEVVEDEARTVRQIFEWAATGLGRSRICERLNTEGWPRIRWWITFSHRAGQQPPASTPTLTPLTG